MFYVQSDDGTTFMEYLFIPYYVTNSPRGEGHFILVLIEKLLLVVLALFGNNYIGYCLG